MSNTTDTFGPPDNQPERLSKEAAKRKYSRWQHPRFGSVVEILYWGEGLPGEETILMREWVDGAPTGSVTQSGTERFPHTYQPIYVPPLTPEEQALADVQRELEQVRTQVQEQQSCITRLEDRERRHAALFGVADGGQYEADWESRATFLATRADAQRELEQLRTRLEMVAVKLDQESNRLQDSYALGLSAGASKIRGVLAETQEAPDGD